MFLRRRLEKRHLSYTTTNLEDELTSTQVMQMLKKYNDLNLPDKGVN